jgi:hypothetical protein
VTVPDPLAAPGRVVNDVWSRTLVVRPAEGGEAALLWRQGVRALEEEADSPTAYFRSAPAPWANGAGEHDIARGVPAADGSLHFKFRRGDPVYSSWCPRRAWARLLWLTGRPAATWVFGSATNREPFP